MRPGSEKRAKYARQSLADFVASSREFGEGALLEWPIRPNLGPDDILETNARRRLTLRSNFNIIFREPSSIGLNCSRYRARQRAESAGTLLY